MADLNEPIAIIGLSARVPGARNVEQFWLNLRNGCESIVFPSREELLSRGVTPAELDDQYYVPAVSMMPDVERFDADLFGMTRREAEFYDPQLRIFLEMTHAAIENAGYDPDRLDGSVGVYGTAGPNNYVHQHILGRDDVASDLSSLTLMTSNNLDYVSTFASYKLNLRGPSFTVLSACSSSLVALHLACQALRIGECDMAIAGGAFVLFPFGHGYRWSPGSTYSRDGHCRAFDAEATGTIFGSGAAAVMVKRLDDALADGDDIRAVIRGSAINNDGGIKSSFAAPSIDGQVAAVMEAMTVADCSPRDISYVEMHGTGTLLGDPVEMAALNRAYRLLSAEPPEPGSCLVGSVKANVGHLVAVAGMVGLIKVVAALENEQLPPSINVSEPNPKLNIESTPFAIDDRIRSWNRTPGRPRTAGISSLGVGGTNAHLVVEEAPSPPRVRADGRPRIVLWSARTEVAEREQRSALAQFFRGLGDEHFADAAATLQQGRTTHAARGAVVTRNPADAVAAIAGIGERAVMTGRAGEPGRLIFAFPGARGDDLRATAQLYGAHPSFTVEADELADRAGRPGAIMELLRDGGLAASDPVASFVVELALARVWKSWGIEPDAVMGEGTGRLAAAVTAGAVDVDSAIAALTDPAVASVTSLKTPRMEVHWSADVRTVTELLSWSGQDRVDAPSDRRSTALVLGSRRPSAAQLASGAGCVVSVDLTGPGGDAHEALLTALARLWIAGHEVEWPMVDPGRPVTRVAMPGYPYQRERFWIERPDREVRAPAVSASPADSVPVGSAATERPLVTGLGWGEKPRTRPAKSASGTAVVLLPPGVRATAELVCSAVRAGSRDPVFLEWPPSPGDGVGSVTALLRRLVADGRAPDLIVHAVSVGDWDRATVANVDEQLRASFSSLFMVAQHVPRVLGRMPEIIVVTTGSLDVSGGEPVQRVKATLHGLVQALRRELVSGRCRLIDLGTRVTAEELSAEIASAGEDGVVALRGTRRWVRREVAVAAEPRSSALRPGGRYLITGGLGGLGLALAEGLAGLGLRPRLVLLQRSGSGRERELDAIRALGAEVEIAECDVADADRLTRTVTELVRDGGPFHGLFHLAGLPGDGMVQFREHADAVAVLRPKVHGTLALEEALRDQPELDFAMHFASRAGVYGAVGSADYAAANSFLDASAVDGGLRARHTVSVDWPPWSGVGMAARSDIGLDAVADGGIPRRVASPAESAEPTESAEPAVWPEEWTTSVSAADDWFLDEHRFDAVPLAPGTALLEMVMRAARELSLVSGAVVMEDVNFRAPLFCQGTCELKVGFRAEGPGWTAGLWFRTRSSDETAWTLAVTARIAAEPASSTGAEIDLAALRKLGPAIERPPVRGRANRLRFGPRWDVVSTVWFGENERLAHLTLPAAFEADLDRHELHPALLDIATGMICMDRSEVFLPFAYRRLVCHGPLPAQIFAHARISPPRSGRVLTADVDVCAPDGRVVVRIAGFTMMTAAGVSSTPTPAGTTEDDALPSGMEEDVLPSGMEEDVLLSGLEERVGTGRPPTALDPRTGVRIALDLLARRTPAQVLVSPSGDIDSGPSPTPLSTPPSPAVEPAPQAEGVLERVRQIWGTVLGLPDVDPDADFFDIDGDSLSAVEVLLRIRDTFGVDLDIAVLVDAPTARDFAKLVEEARATS